MNKLLSYRAIGAFFVYLIAFVNISFAEVVRTDLAQLGLHTDKTSVAPGSEFSVIIEMDPDEGWHGYWENPGDAGLKLEMEWQIPDGVEIDALQFKTPHLIPFEEIVSYGYEGKVTIVADGRVSEDFVGDNVVLNGSAFWLICSDALCVPQDAKISHQFEIGEDIVDENIRNLVLETKADMPIQENWESEFHTDGENFTLKSVIPAEYPVIERAYLYPYSEGMMENTYYQDLSFINGEIIGRFENAYGYEDKENFEFVLTFKTGEGEEHAVMLTATKSLEPVAEVMAVASTEEVTPLTSLDFTTALLFAFLGGVILNLMPCVFPILSLKAMSVVELSKKDSNEARVSGLIYTAGIMATFGLIGALVSILSLGWGFHMQIPLVNFALGLLMVAIGLNLLGVFEFGGSFVGVGQSMTESDGTKAGTRKSAFFTGVLAVVVATPCTAPFMASALGYAFISGGVTGLLIFLSLGLGLAFPYLLICYVPGLRNALPRPGAWMETMKNILGFPMLATALWLFWILGNQVGVDGLTLAIVGSLFLGALLWSISKNGIAFKVLKASCLAGVLYAGYLLHTIDTQKPVEVAANKYENQVPFSSMELDEMLARNASVFVYFTADWCVTCKLNERVALSQPSVHQAFVDKNITVMVGDWTNQNPDITKTLQRYGRIGVPLYLYFPEGRSKDNPDILPQILTPDLVIEAL